MTRLWFYLNLRPLKPILGLEQLENLHIIFFAYFYIFRIYCFAYFCSFTVYNFIKSYNVDSLTQIDVLTSHADVLCFVQQQS